MLKPVIVIKLGGSALTQKSMIYTPRLPAIRSAAGQIAEIAKRFSVVLVHGAGSYGHIPVRRFHLGRGFSGRKQLKGLAETKFKLAEWQMILSRAFSRRGVSLLPVTASDVVHASNGRIQQMDLAAIGGWLKLGCVPAIGGDLVPDSTMGFSVISGDQIAEYLAVKLNARLLIFATDVDGIFDSNPKLHSGARILQELTPAQALRVAKRSARTVDHDVTGGMAGKIREAARAADKGVPVFFVNLLKNRRLAKVAFGKRTLSSRIARSEFRGAAGRP